MESVRKLATQVTQGDLTFGNAGGNLWNQVKFETGFVPSFGALRHAKLWTEQERFKLPVWSWLTDGAEDWTVETAGKIMNAMGRVEKVQIDVGDKKELFHWGDVSQIMKTRRMVDLVWLELKEENSGMDDDAIAVISQGARQPGGV